VNDRRLRALERRFEESGSEPDELAYLHERVRTGGALGWERYSRLAELNVEAAADYLKARVERGELEQERLELAAHCSHSPAIEVVGRPKGCSEVPFDLAALDDWTQLTLASYGVEVWQRAAVAAAREAFRSWSAVLPEDPRPLEFLEAAEESLCGTRSRTYRTLPLVPFWFMTDEACRRPEGALWCAKNAFLSLRNPAPHHVSFAVHIAGEVATPPKIREALRLDLVPWSLGAADPVRSRVAKRQGTHL